MGTVVFFGLAVVARAGYDFVWGWWVAWRVSFEWDTDFHGFARIFSEGGVLSRIVIRLRRVAIGCRSGVVFDFGTDFHGVGF